MTAVPPGWSLRGFSAPQSDGSHLFRVPARVTEVAFETGEPRYVAFRYQLYSPEQYVQGKVTLDGQPAGNFTFPAGRFVNVYAGGFVGAGRHVLRSEQGCALTCPLRQYFAEVKLLPTGAGRQEVNFSAQRLNLDVPAPPARLVGLSSVQFDGTHPFRSLDSPAPATITLPTPLPLVSVSYTALSEGGSFRLTWRAGGQPPQAVGTRWLRPRTEPGDVLPARVPVEQYLSLGPQRPVQTLEVRGSCEGGGTACFPVRLYSTQLVARGPATAGPSLQGWLGAGLLLALLTLLLRWLLFRSPVPPPRAAGG